MRLWRNMRAPWQWTGLAACVLVVGSLTAVAQQSANRQESQTSHPGSDSPLITANISQATGLNELPDSPGATRWALQRTDPTQTSSASQSNSASVQQTSPQTEGSPQQAASQNSPAPQRPVGTAAAEAPPTSGIAASQPAGVAIAPAKQRRVRTIVLKVGAIVAGGVALGTVIALTEATPSKPPGAH